MIEYLMLKGMNDRPQDLFALTTFLDGIKAHINLIPFNAYEGCGLVGTTKSEREAFANALKDAGFDVQDIMEVKTGKFAFYQDKSGNEFGIFQPG